MGVILPNSSRVSLLTYKAIVAVRYPELVAHRHGPLQIGYFTANDQTIERGSFRAVFWDAPKDLRNAVEDIVVLLEHLQEPTQEYSSRNCKSTPSLVQPHSCALPTPPTWFQTSWRRATSVDLHRLLVPLPSLLSLSKQLAASLGRRGDTPDDGEVYFGRTTVALTRAIQHTYIISPVDMAGLICMAQTLAVFHFGITP